MWQQAALSKYCPSCQSPILLLSLSDAAFPSQFLCLFLPLMSLLALQVLFPSLWKGEGVDSDVGAGGADKDRKSLFSLTLSHTDPQDRRDGNVSSFADMFLYILIHITLIL